MKKYSVKIRETTMYSVEVEAGDETEAMKVAIEDQYRWQEDYGCCEMSFDVKPIKAE